jgi:hypothetical protein
MTEQPGGEIPVSKLQPLDFRLILDDGKAAIYQAVTVDREVPGVPVYTVTVTIASDVRRKAEEQLQAFLGEMRAAFSLLREPPPEDGPPDDEEFDINTQMQIELNLVSLNGLKDDELVGVAATVETSVGPGQITSGSDADSGVVIRNVAPNTIPPGGKDQYWWAFCNYKLQGTVTPTGGSGNMRNPRTNVNVSNPHSLTARQIIVHSDHGMSYFFGGSFSGPHSGPRKGKPC